MSFSKSISQTKLKNDYMSKSSQNDMGQLCGERQYTVLTYKYIFLNNR